MNRILKLLNKIVKRLEYRQEYQKRKEVMTSNYAKLSHKMKLTKEQKKETQDFYTHLIGHMVPLFSHEYFYSRTGVFNKDCLDFARQQMFYTYSPLTDSQIRSLPEGQYPVEYIYRGGQHAPLNMFRTVGVDFDANKTLTNSTFYAFISLKGEMTYDKNISK